MRVLCSVKIGSRILSLSSRNEKIGFGARVGFMRAKHSSCEKSFIIHHVVVYPPRLLSFVVHFIGITQSTLAKQRFLEIEALCVMLGVRRKRSSTSSSKSQLKSSKKQNASIDFTLDDNDHDESKNSRDDIIESEDEMENESLVDSSEDEKETVDAKKIRMAREYLSKMEQSDGDSSDVVSSSDEGEDEEFMNEDHRISKRLERHRLKQQGMYERQVASKVKENVDYFWNECDSNLNLNGNVEAQTKAWVENGQLKLCRGHDLTPTCVALHSPSGAVAYSASKDNSILMWDIENEKKMNTIVKRWNPNACDYTRNSGEVLCMVASDDGRFLATGGRDATVKIYDVRQKNKATLTISDKDNEIDGIRGLVTTFEGHKGPVTALALRSQSLQLFSGSNDRCIRHYNLDQMAYIETLYGHQAGITGISCHGIRHEMPFSVARDRTARAWKLAEETHMIYRGGSKVSNADCITAIKDDYFLTGHDDGILSFWLKDKKRAIMTTSEAHGMNGSLPRGIASCTNLGGSDLAATGSNDGYLRLWQVSSMIIFSIRNTDHLKH